MATTFVYANVLLVVISIILNTLRLLTIHNFEKKMNAVMLARILTPSCILLTSVIVFVVDSFIISNLQNKPKTINTLQETFEVFQIGIYLGVNVVESVTKFRVYHTAGRAATILTRKSVLVPACVVGLVALLGSLGVFILESSYSDSTSLSGFSTYGFVFQLTFYHAFGILPVVSVYLILALQAFLYYKKSTLNARIPFSSKKITPQRKQLISISQYVLLYYLTLVCSWSPFLALKILWFTSTNMATVQLYKTLILSSKLVMLALNPIANGMLQKRDRQQTMLLVSGFLKRSKEKFFNLGSGFINNTSGTPVNIELCSDQMSNNSPNIEICSDKMSNYSPSDHKTPQISKYRCQRDSYENGEERCNVTMFCLENQKYNFPGNAASITDVMNPIIKTEDKDRLCVRRLNYALPELRLLSVSSFDDSDVSAFSAQLSAGVSHFVF